MKLRLCLAASTLAFSAFLAAAAMAQDNSTPPSTPGHTDANGMPTDHSTSAEHAATADLNNQAADDNAKADAQSNSQADQNSARYQAQQQQYQDQLRQNQKARSQYLDRTIAYQTRALKVIIDVQS